MKKEVPEKSRMYKIQTVDTFFSQQKNNLLGGPANGVSF